MLKLVLAGLSIAGYLALVPEQSEAQDVRYGSFVHRSSSPSALILDGPIEQGSVQDFRRALREHDVDIVVLNSGGGAVVQGLELSAIVNDRGLDTYIPPSASCASACSFIFFAGASRIAEGQLGVHQFATNRDGTVSRWVTEQVTQEVAGQIMAYLHEYGTPSKVFVRMFETAPDDMYFFTRDEIREEGIEIASRRMLPEIEFRPQMPRPASPPPVASPANPSPLVQPLLSDAAICDRLWYERNLLFARKGYCFGTPKGIAVFGNESCYTDSPTLTVDEKTYVDQLRAMESLNGC